MTGHDLIDVSYVTSRTVGWADRMPVREPIADPHSRWYCACGTVGGKIHGSTEKDAKSKAKLDHKRHVADATTN